MAKPLECVRKTYEKMKTTKENDCRKSEQK